METIPITVDGKPFDAKKDSMLLDSLEEMGIHVPTLCHHPSLEPNGACRLCMVEITHPDWKGWSGLVTSCLYPVEPGLQVSTRSERVKQSRRTLLELYLARCPDSEAVSGLARSEGVEDTPFPLEEGADKCVHCWLCTRVCQDLGPCAIAPLGRGADKEVGPRPDHVGEDCTGCGACAHICPTGQIRMERQDGKLRIWNRDFDIPVCSVRQELCEGCGECAKACPLDIPKLSEKKGGASVSSIDPAACTGCGICAGGCAAGAIRQEGVSSDHLCGREIDPEHLKGRTVIFACSRSALPENTEGVIQVPCIGRVSVENMVECLARGADGVLLMCRDQATCPTGRGGQLAAERIKAAEALAGSARLGKGRIKYVKPRPGPEGPKEALAEFQASLPPSPLREPYTRSEENLTGMDRILEMRRWLKLRPELSEYELQPIGTGIKRPLFGFLGKRRVVQAVSLVFLHSSFWNWAQLKWFCNPVLSCHSCPLAIFACPVGVFVHYSGYHVFPFVAVGTVLFLGVLFGRLLCGWVCPFGFLQDLLYKIPTMKFVMPDWTRFVKYGVLILMVFMLPFLLGELTYLSFCRICPAAALQSTLPRMIDTGVDLLQTAVVIKLGFLVLFLVVATLSNRAFCKVVCPIGAMLAPLNLISFWKIKTTTMTCMKCSWCDNKCPPNGAPSSRISADVPPNRVMDCVYCYECKNACPMSEEVDLNAKCHARRA